MPLACASLDVAVTRSGLAPYTFQQSRSWAEYDPLEYRRFQVGEKHEKMTLAECEQRLARPLINAIVAPHQADE